MAATVSVVSGDGEEEVTTDTYRAWKKRNPGRAFVTTVGGQEVVADTHQEMHSLPGGTFAGQLVEMVMLPMRTSVEAWRVVQTAPASIEVQPP